MVLLVKFVMFMYSLRCVKKGEKTMSYHKQYDTTPDFEELSSWDTYCKQLQIEYEQSIEEGLDIEKYKESLWQFTTLSTTDTR
jgi:hypothetical protein